MTNIGADPRERLGPGQACCRVVGWAGQARSGIISPTGAPLATGDGDRNDEAASLAAALLSHGAECYVPVAVTVHPVPPRDSPYGRSWARVRRAVLARDCYRCHICGLPGADSVDHLDPVATHGPAIPPLNRLAAAHVGCNGSRARLLERERGTARPSYPSQPWLVTRGPGRRVWWGAIEPGDLARRG